MQSRYCPFGQTAPTFVGSYVPADQYTTPSAVFHCAESAPAPVPCNSTTQAVGPCSAGFGLSSKQLFPSAISPCDGFDQVVVSAPLDLLYADNLMDDVNVLTTTRGQTYDLRGEPAIAAAFSCDQSGQLAVGPFGGTQQSLRGPYEYRKAVRTYIV